MTQKSVRFIARDFNTSINQIREVIEELGIKPDDYSYQGTPTYNDKSQLRIQVKLNKWIDWICDGCGADLNSQEGFTTSSGTWTCKECGCINDVTENNIIWEQ